MYEHSKLFQILRYLCSTTIVVFGLSSRLLEAFRLDGHKSIRVWKHFRQLQILRYSSCVETGICCWNQDPLDRVYLHGHRSMPMYYCLRHSRTSKCSFLAWIASCGLSLLLSAGSHLHANKSTRMF